MKTSCGINDRTNRGIRVGKEGEKEFFELKSEEEETRGESLSKTFNSVK
jgi:hypothetical protein